jgi:hypothetical protein
VTVTCPACKQIVEPAPLERGAYGWRGAPRFCPTRTGPLSRCETDLASVLLPDGGRLLQPPEEPRAQPRELTIQERIEAYLETLSPEVWFHRMVVGQVERTDHKTGRTWTINYGIVGGADILVCARGLWLELEVKSATGRQERSQKKHEASIRAAGGRYYLVRSVDEARAAVEATLGLASKGSSIPVYEAGVRYYQEQAEIWKARALELERQIQGGQK